MTQAQYDLLGNYLMATVYEFIVSNTPVNRVTALAASQEAANAAIGKLKAELGVTA